MYQNGFFVPFSVSCNLQYPSVYFQNCMGFGEYLDQIIRSHLTVAESTELTIKLSYPMGIIPNLVAPK